MKYHELISGANRQKRSKRVGRGIGSNKGKTSTRGHKGDKSRSGYKKRYGKEGGQVPLFKKMPTRGFSNVRFATKYFTLNLYRINDLFEDGDTVNVESLEKKGFALRKIKGGLKILGDGELKKKVKIEASLMTASAKRKLQEQKIEFTIK